MEKKIMKALLSGRSYKNSFCKKLERLIKAYTFFSLYKTFQLFTNNKLKKNGEENSGNNIMDESTKTVFLKSQNVS